MSNATRLLQEVIYLFQEVGVTPGVGKDGDLMLRIQQELANAGEPSEVKPKITIPRGRCPVCGCPNLMDCECDPNEQLRLLEQQ